MFAEERQQGIVKLVKKNGKVSVSELSARYAVTTATIRADLKVLEEGGVIIKTHGGAILNSKASFELGSEQRKSINEQQKHRIGELAAELVKDNETIILDTGTTTLHIARHLTSKKSLTVITNDFEVARILEEATGVQIIFLGGLVKKGYHCTYHTGAAAILNSLNVDKAFMATNAFSLNSGACVADLTLAETKQAMIRRARETLLICDSSKLGQSSLAQFASSEQIDYLITDQMPSDSQLYQELGIKLLLAAQD